jgi:hypothetical protein
MNIEQSSHNAWRWCFLPGNQDHACKTCASPYCPWRLRPRKILQFWLVSTFYVDRRTFVWKDFIFREAYRSRRVWGFSKVSLGTVRVAPYLTTLMSSQPNGQPREDVQWTNLSGIFKLISVFKTIISCDNKSGFILKIPDTAKEIMNFKINLLCIIELINHFQVY